MIASNIAINQWTHFDPLPPLKYPFIIQMMPKHVEILNVDDIDDKDSIYNDGGCQLVTQGDLIPVIFGPCLSTILNSHQYYHYHHGLIFSLIRPTMSFTM